MKNEKRFYILLYTINETVSSVVSVLAFWKAYDIKNGLHKFCKETFSNYLHTTRQKKFGHC